MIDFFCNWPGWPIVGHTLQFILALVWIAVGFVLGVWLFRYTIKVYEDVRWWK